MITTDPPVTTAELRAAFGRARLLRFHGYTFESAMAIPVLRWALARSAQAHRTTAKAPAQPRLI